MSLPVKFNLKHIALGVSCILLSACSDNDSSSESYEAEIRYTNFGIPHITASNYKNLSFGIGYDHGQENLCTVSEQLMKLKSQKSEFLGVGEDDANLLTDVGYKALDYPSQAEELYSQLSDIARDMIKGYAAGFNKALSERASPQEYPSPCRGAEWVQPVTEQDLLAYQLDLAGLSSARNFLEASAMAHPPVAAAKTASRSAALPSIQLDADKVLTSKGIGSNGWAFGKNRVEGADASLLGNPHFPWDGELRFYQSQLTIPGELNISGAGLVGVPGVLIGFNDALGWTHTVSQSKRFILYQLTLDENDPTRYMYDGESRAMTSKEVSIKIKNEDGTMGEHTQTVFFSHFGPMVDLSSLSPILGWTTSTAMTYRDANAGNIQMVDQWLAMSKAKNKEEFFQAFSDHQALPWVNTIMASEDGTAHYIDGTRVPQLSATAEAYWAGLSQNPLLAPIWQDGGGSVLLPGNSSDFEWVDSQNAGAPGLVPFSKAPQQSRDDYVFNANSSHWLSNLDAPLTGFSLMYGPEGTVRSPRTRYNALLISDTSGTGLAGSDNNFTFEELKSVLTHNGSLFAGDFRNSLVSRCTNHSSITVDEQVVDLTAICTALRDWDGLYNLDSRGAHIMREFLVEFKTSSHRTLENELFATEFDEQNPVTTPSGLVAIDSENVDADPVLQALAAAATRLTAAGIAFDAPLGNIQYLIKAEGKDSIPVSGGYSYEGIFNYTQTNTGRSTSDFANIVIGETREDSPLTSLDEDGTGATERYRVNYGSSFVMALEYKDGEPNAEMLYAYSQSHDPESEHFDDLTEKFSELSWQPMYFTEAEVEENTVRTVNISN